MSNVVKEFILDTDPGMGINANPFESEIYLDLTGPMGSLSGLYYSLMFQLGKNGFFVFKMDESINVSPMFKQYWELTIHQKEALEAQMKSGLAQIATAIHDYDLVSHDLRKYQEYLDYYTKIEKGLKLLKAKKKEEAEEGAKLQKEGLQTLRSVFIDQVDAHTGDISIRSITQRWPTIIVDFMRLDDKDTDQKKISERYEISEAEGAVLGTKNKLFVEWKDNLFKPTLKERYQNVLRLTEARKTSIEKYSEMLKPVVARYKMINDSLEGGGGRAGSLKAFFPAASQAFSIDNTRIWAILPFAPAEKYKVTRDYLDEIPIRKAGFTRDQIEELVAGKKISDRDMLVPALPVEPSIDEIVLRYLPKVENYYKVKLNAGDIYDARKRLTNLFLRKALETRGGESYSKIGEFVAPGMTWTYSPYFVFLDLPFERAVIKLPNGTEMENLMITNMTVQNRTQNVVIVTLLELIAREKQMENYIGQLLGEQGLVSETGSIPVFKEISEVAKERYPEIFGGKPDEGKEKKSDQKNMFAEMDKLRTKFGKFLDNTFGLKFDILRARGPYEFAVDDRLAEMFQLETMYQGYLFVLRYLQRGSGVPAIRV
ncbi:MAG: hypothetical protein HYW23_00080 [Candidatus Aenigmarchaeota archaeon]|nr:hypothetical protein [Candidatus Aenigmarchaeota archaeon]